MKISSYQMASINSLKQAINIGNMMRAVNQDAQSVDNIVKMMEKSVNPNKGGNIDIRL